MKLALLSRLRLVVVMCTVGLAIACTMRLNPYSPTPGASSTTGSGASSTGNGSSGGDGTGSTSASRGTAGGGTSGGDTSGSSSAGTFCPIPTAVPNADDTALLQGLIQTAAESANKVVSLDPNRTYVVNDQIQIPDGVTVDGGGCATISSNNPNAVAWMNALIVAGNNVTIANLNFNLVFANSSTPGAGILIGSGATNTVVEHVGIQGSNVWVGVYLGSLSMQNITVQNSQFSGIGYGVLLSINQIQTDISQSSGNITIADNQLSRLSSDAIAINSPVTADTPNATGNPDFVATHILITGNQISDVGFGISNAGGKDVVISDNVITRSAYNGIHLEDTAANVLIQNNTIDGVLAPTATYFSGYIDGIWMDHCTQIKIIDNTIAHAINKGVDIVYDAPLTQSGAQFDPYRYANNITIAGNSFVDPGDYAINAGGGGASDNLAVWIGPDPNQDLLGNSYVGAQTSDVCVVGNPNGVTITDSVIAVQCN